MNITEESIVIDDKKLTLQFGKLAQAVDTSVYAQLGDTVVLVTVAVGQENPSIDYFPLSVEYVEKLYAGGVIKGSRWVKREARPSDEAILIGRLIDRSIRPLFPKTYKKQVQVVITLLSVDGINSPDILAAIATSAALHVSSIPWNGPIATLRAGYLREKEGGNGELILNPDETEQRLSELDLVVASNKEKVLMIETEALEMSEDVIEKGVELIKQSNIKIIEFIDSLRGKIGKPKDVTPDEAADEKILNLIKEKYAKDLEEYVIQQAKGAESLEKLQEITDSLYEELKPEYDKKQVANAIQKFNYQKIKQSILKGKRPDGRKVDEIRPLYVESSLLPRTHGSAIFQRGQTQVMSIATLGALTLEQLIEGPEGKEAKRYMHHYSDGPYSYGQAGRMGSPSRRAIGHGALAEKGIEPVLPTAEEFPYAIRVVSEILSENGSSSMGSICGSSMALMDAGVPIKAAVAGLAMGIVTKDDNDYMILSDIVGLEDFAGEMDFKIAGTKDGITAIQLDVKNNGLTQEMIHKTFAQSKKNRVEILNFMNKTIDKPRKEISKYAPKVVVLTPPQEKIGEIIGPGGRNIRNLIARTETEINIDDEGRVTVSGIDHEKVQAAVKHIQDMTREVQPGEKFEGEVKRILPFGAFVEILPGKDGMVHVSKMGKGFVKDPSTVVKIGQKVKVEVEAVDQQGRINLRMISSEKSNDETPVE